VRGFALLFVVLLVACGSTKLQVFESPSRRFGGVFVMNDIAVDPSVTARTAHDDAASLTRELRGALAYIAQDGAGDDRFVVYARLVEYSDMMTLAIDVLDRRNARIARFTVSAPASRRGWTDAARETAREDIVIATANYLRSNR
jgi:hypothetical protein